MRIAMIGQKGVPARSGGVERHVHDLVRRLHTSEHRIFVYARKSYLSGDTFSSGFFGSKRIFIPTLKNKYLETVLHTFFSTIHALFLRIDVFHFHGIGPALFSWIPRIFRPSAKVVLTFHCQDYYHQKWGIASRAAFRLGEFIGCAVSHEIIVVSRLLERYVENTYGRVATYIPNTVLLEGERGDSRILQELGLRPNDYFLSVSRLVRHKGVHTIVKAYLELLKESPLSPDLAIVGDSSFTDVYAAELKKLAKHNPKIHFFGERNHDELAHLYRGARLFIHASQTEGLSYTLLEAMSFGCPVLVSDIAENAEVLPSIGIQFRSNDVHDLKEKMLHCLAIDSGRVEEERAVYKGHVQTNYNFEDAFCRSLALYESLSA